MAVRRLPESAPADPPLRREVRRSPLHFMVCGSAGHGKSTLLGRILDAAGVPSGDAATSPTGDSNRRGAAGGDPAFWLTPETITEEGRQAGSTESAYRAFSTVQRDFIVADASGREAHVRHVAAAASNVDLAVIVVDAAAGLQSQTLRHAYITALFGVRHIMLAVNRMDSVGYDRAAYEAVVTPFRTFAARIGLDRFHAVPVSALEGDNVSARSADMAWYGDPTLLDILETADVEGRADGPFRMAVQRVLRPDPSSPGCAGTIEQGSVRPGDAVTALPSGGTTTVMRIVTADGDLDVAAAGQTVTLVLGDECDVSPGDIIAPADDALEVADQFAVHMVWFGEEPLYPGRPYRVRMGTRTFTGQITELKHRIDVNTLDELAARHLERNDIAYGTLALEHAIPFEPYDRCHGLGGFLLIDRYTDATVGCGMIDFALWRATTVPWQDLEITKASRADLTRQQPAVLWFTGLSGAGKSTIANELAKRLHARGRFSYLLDGDNVRHGLNRDLGFRPEDRVENVRRVAEVAKLFVDAGLIVLVSLISPFRNERMMARELMEPGEFLEIFVDTPLEECERRDPKGLYARARTGAIRNFTGIDSPYERPEMPEILLDTVGSTPDALADRIVTILEERGLI